MGKRHNKKNKVEESTGVEVLTELKEEMEMTEKKGFLTKAGEFVDGLPKPVKVVGGIALGVGTAVGAVVVAYNKLKGDKEDSYIDCDEDSYEESAADTPEETTTSEE